MDVGPAYASVHVLHIVTALCRLLYMSHALFPFLILVGDRSLVVDVSERLTEQLFPSISEMAVYYADHYMTVHFPLLFLTLPPHLFRRQISPLVPLWFNFAIRGASLIPRICSCNKISKSCVPWALISKNWHCQSCAISIPSCLVTIAGGWSVEGVTTSSFGSFGPR